MSIKVSSSLSAEIIQWDSQKGYGFLKLGTERVFLHRREFADRHRTPVVGDKVQFSLGEDAKGRVCAKNAVLDGAPASRLATASWIILALPLPLYAGWLAGMNLLVAGGFLLATSSLTYLAYAIDKSRALTGAWRLPENHLHLLELIGGWPGAWVAQQRLRHKCSKRNYLIVFWIIVLGWQFAAVDSLCDWRWSRAFLQQAGKFMERGK